MYPRAPVVRLVIFFTDSRQFRDIIKRVVSCLDIPAALQDKIRILPAPRIIVKSDGKKSEWHTFVSIFQLIFENQDMWCNIPVIKSSSPLTKGTGLVNSWEIWKPVHFKNMEQFPYISEFVNYRIKLNLRQTNLNEMKINLIQGNLMLNIYQH